MPATLHFSLRDDWRALKRGRPGRRFLDHYEQTRRAEPRCGVAKRIVTSVVAAVALAIGLFFALFPGPAIPFFVIAGALLAAHSRPIARAMDWIELRVRAVLAWMLRRWRRLPRSGRIAVPLLVVCGGLIVAYFVFRFFFG